MNKLLLIDGSNLLFQMFFGMPARIVNHEGKPIQGTLGFIGALLKLIRMTEPTHLAVLFDGEHENPRCALDPDYKSNRPDYGSLPEGDSPFSQLPDIKAALDFLAVPWAETASCETDDWIAGYAAACGQDWEIVISSFDSDFFQLLSERVSVLRYRGEKTVLCTPAFLKEKFGVSPAQYADFKSLTGDAADHIRGAEKVGPKTAAALLKEFGSLEGVLSHIDQVQKPSVKSSLTACEERLHKNYRLIKLEPTAPLPFPPEELACRIGPVTTNEVLKGIGLRI